MFVPKASLSYAGFLHEWWSFIIAHWSQAVCFFPAHFPPVNYHVLCLRFCVLSVVSTLVLSKASEFETFFLYSQFFGLHLLFNFCVLNDIY